MAIGQFACRLSDARLGQSQPDGSRLGRRVSPPAPNVGLLGADSSITPKVLSRRTASRDNGAGILRQDPAGPCRVVRFHLPSRPVVPAMVALPHLALSDFFQLLQRPTHVLGTSYTLSLAFFEALVFPRIPRSALRRCLLLADRHGFRRALVEAGALRHVGRDYMAACVPCAHSFHPKVWLALGEGEAAILVGSGNLTRSGFMDNAELFDAVHLRKGGPHRAVAEGLIAFLAGLHGQWSAAAGDRDLLVLDSLSEMRLLAQNPLRYRRQILALLSRLLAELRWRFRRCARPADP